MVKTRYTLTRRARNLFFLNRNRYNPVHPITTGMNPSRNMSRKRKDLFEPITGIPVTVPINQRGILPVVSAIYLTPFHILLSGHTRDINSHSIDNYAYWISSNGVRILSLFLIEKIIGEWNSKYKN